MSVVEEVVTTEDHTGAVAVTTVAADDNQNYTAMYASPGNSAPANTGKYIELQIRGGIEGNSKIVFLISHLNHML